MIFKKASYDPFNASCWIKVVFFILHQTFEQLFQSFYKNINQQKLFLTFAINNKFLSIKSAY